MTVIGRTPFLELAARQDDGDGVTGTGLELAGGLRFAAPGVDVGGARARAGGAHPGGHRGAGVERDRTDRARGARPRAVADAEPALGHGRGAGAVARRAADGGRGAAGRCRRARRADRLRVGLAPHGLLTPFAEAGLAGDDWRLRLGTRFEAAHMNLGVELAGEHREGGAAGPEQMLKLDLRLRH